MSLVIAALVVAALLVNHQFSVIELVKFNILRFSRLTVNQVSVLFVPQLENEPGMVKSCGGAEPVDDAADTDGNESTCSGFLERVIYPSTQANRQGIELAGVNDLRYSNKVTWVQVVSPLAQLALHNLCLLQNFELVGHVDKKATLNQFYVHSGDIAVVSDRYTVAVIETARAGKMQKLECLPCFSYPSSLGGFELPLQQLSLLTRFDSRSTSSIRQAISRVSLSHASLSYGFRGISLSLSKVRLPLSFVRESTSSVSLPRGILGKLLSVVCLGLQPAYSIVDTLIDPTGAFSEVPGRLGVLIGSVSIELRGSNQLIRLVRVPSGISYRDVELASRENDYNDSNSQFNRSVWANPQQFLEEVSCLTPSPLAVVGEVLMGCLFACACAMCAAWTFCTKGGARSKQASAIICTVACGEAAG
jgi:hypothetical protein